MTATDVTLNGIALSAAVPEAAVLRVKRELLGGRRDTFVEVPGRPGSWVFAEEPGDRRLELELDIQATTFAGRRAAVEALAEWADTPAGAYTLVIDDHVDRYYEAVLGSAPAVDEWLNNAGVTLDYRVGPYAFAVSTSSTSITASAGAASGTFSAADEVIAYPVIEVTPLNGTVTAFTIQLNGDTLSWSGSLASGSTVTVSSISFTVTDGVNSDVNLTGAYISGDVNMSTIAGDFPLVVPSTNSYAFTTTGTATAVRFRITWRRRYR